jgi:hypothetical protein
MIRRTVLIALALLLPLHAKAQFSPQKEKILLQQLNTYANTIFSLASESFARHESKNETWLLLVHQSTNADTLVKYKQGNITVASLPATAITLQGAQLYATRYNFLTLQKADQLALSGQYTNALEIYRVAEQFAQGLEHSDNLKRRIAAIEKLLKNQDAPKNLKTIQSLLITNAPSTFDLLETKPALTTTNLLSIDFPGRYKEEPADEEEKDQKTPTN